MKTRGLFIVLLFVLLAVGQAFAQGSIKGKLTVGNTELANGQIKIGEKLTTQDGVSVEPGIYRIILTQGTTGETQFVLNSPKATDEPTGIQKNAVNRVQAVDNSIVVPARITKNLLVKGIASNIEGSFNLATITPTETRLMFNSKQLEAAAVFGRSPDSKVADMIPVFVSLEQPASCGDDCMEGLVKVIVRNDGNAPAKGKWNVTVVDPQLFVGTLVDLAPGVEQTVVSSTKIKLPCCGAAQIEAEVHADFYNKDGADANESNNIKRFSINLKQ
jgi:hypothetical protein